MFAAHHRRRVWALAAVLACALAGSTESRAGIILKGGKLHPIGDPLYIYSLSAQMSEGSTFEQGDSFSILGVIGAGKVLGVFPPLHFEPSDDGSLPLYNFTFNLVPDKPLPAPFPQDVLYPSSNVTWTNSSGPAVLSGTEMGEFGVMTSVILPELYPTIPSITLPWIATINGGQTHESGFLTFYLYPEPSSLLMALGGALGFAGYSWYGRRRRAADAA